MAGITVAAALESPFVDAADVTDGPALILERAPAEDAGAATARWYSFQYATAVRNCLAMVASVSSVTFILCEWHTDYVIGWQDKSCALVSVKYREPDSGAWTVPRLFSEGGLAVFMRRWLECGRPKESRWLTNGGLDVDCRQLRDACAGGRQSSVRDFAQDLAARFGQAAADVAAFLSTLRLDSNLPAVDNIRVLDVDQYARRALRELGLAPDNADEAYGAVLALVEAAAQSFGDSPDGWLVAEPGALDEDWLIRDNVARRLITRQQVIDVLAARAQPAAATLPTLTPPITRLLAKLKAGEIVPSVLAAARRARRTWTEYERGLTCPLPGQPIGLDFQALRERLTAEATEAQLAAFMSGIEPYGNLMLKDMFTRVAAVACDRSQSQYPTARLLMGLVYDLTAQCEIWWSSEFDVDKATQ
jgi:hypothetical protein